MTANENAVTVQASDLVSAIGRALPFVSDDETMPQLTGVLLEAGNGRLTATATDRYTLGHARVAATGALSRVFVPTVTAKHVVRLFTPDGPYEDPPVSVDLLDGALRFTTVPGGSVLSVVPRDVQFPDVAKIVASVRDRHVGATGPIGLNPRYMARFAKVEEYTRDRFEPEHMRVYVYGPAHPVVVESADDDFIGMIMPIRLRDDVTSKPRVPYGIDEPAGEREEAQSPATVPGDGTRVLNPEAIGDPNQTPVVQLGPDLAAAVARNGRLAAERESGGAA